MDIKKQNILAIMLLMVIVILVMASIKHCRRVATIENAFSLMVDISEFYRTHEYLPESIKEFCDWKLDEKRQRKWSSNYISKEFNFLWLLPKFSTTNDTLIEVINPDIKMLQEILNERLKGLSSSNGVMNIKIKQKIIKM